MRIRYVPALGGGNVCCTNMSFMPSHINYHWEGPIFGFRVLGFQFYVASRFSAYSTCSPSLYLDREEI